MERVSNRPLNTKTFAIGQEWCYFKIYAGFKTGENILVNKIFPCVLRLLETGKITKWFFIRYNDPEYHIRLRLQLASQAYLNEVVMQLNQILYPYLNRRIIWRFQMASYERELARYGGINIGLSEDIFYHDSNMILETFITMNHHELDENYRWLSCIKAIDHLMSAFLGTESLMQKQRFIAGYLSAGKKANYFNKDHKRNLSKRYRYHEALIAEMLEHPTKAPEKQLHLILPPIEKKSQFIQPIAQELRSKFEHGEINISFQSFINSHIHMMANRYFRTQAVICEYVLYFYLDRYYTTQVKRNQ